MMYVMKKIAEEELYRTLELHQKWLEGKPDGVCADLSDTDLSYTNLNGVDLRYANLSGADLSHTDLSDSDLSNADLTAANLFDSCLIDTKLDNVMVDNETLFFDLQCPEEGSFVGYKVAMNKIVVLQITEDAKRSSGTTRNCRCSKAKVLRIEDLNGNILDVWGVVSNCDSNFVYEVGKTVEVKDFDEDRWNEDSTGIHFFMTKKEAIRYNF